MPLLRRLYFCGHCNPVPQGWLQPRLLCSGRHEPAACAAPGAWGGRVFTGKSAEQGEAQTRAQGPPAAAAALAQQAADALGPAGGLAAASLRHARQRAGLGFIQQF